MSTIPLPALHVEAPQQQDMLGNLQKLMMLKNAQQQQQMGQQEIQQRQMDIESQKALQKAYMDAGGDPDKTTQLAAKSGQVKPQTLLAWQEAATKIKAANLDLVLKQGEKAKLDADLMQGAHDAVDQAQDKPAEYQRQLLGLQQRGLDVSQMPQQYPGDEQFKLIGAIVKGHTQGIDEAFKQAETEKNKQQAAASQAEEARKAELAPYELQKAKNEAAAGGTSDIATYTMNWLKANNMPDTPGNRLLAHQAFTKETKIQPAQVRVEGYGKIRQFPVYDNQTKQTVYMDSNEINDAKLTSPGRYTVPQYTPEQVVSKEMAEGTKQITKPLTAFNTAITHLDTLDRLASDLNNTNLMIANRAKQKWAQETGNPAPANFAAAVNAMSGEVAAALKSSGATDQEIAHVGATFDRAESPSQLKGAINTYRELLTSKKGQLQKQYEAGKQGQPAFGQPQGGQEIHYKIVNGQLVKQ